MTTTRWMSATVALAIGISVAACTADVTPAPTSMATGPAASAAAPTSPTPSSTLHAPAPKPKPKPAPVRPALYFSGDYRVVLKMTKTTHPGYYRKSKTKKTSWSISSVCTKKRCRSAVDTRFVSEDFTLTYRSHHWRGTSRYKLHCLDTKTGKRAGPDVRQRETFNLKRTRSNGAVATRLEGVDHLRQLDACGGLERTVFHVVLTRL